MEIYTFARISMLYYAYQMSSASILFSNKDAISFIKDILDFQKLPTFVNGFLCWNRETLLDLTKTLSAGGYRSNVFLACKKDQITFPDYLSLYVLDLGCPFSLGCLKDAEFAKLFASPHRWLILYTSTSQIPTISTLPPQPQLANESIESTFQFESDITVDAGLNLDEKPLIFSDYYKEKSIVKDARYQERVEKFLFDNCSMLCDSEVVFARLIDGKRFKLTQIYKRRPGATIIEEDYGWWSLESGITDYKLTEVTSLRRLNLQGTVIGASVVINANDTIQNLRNYGNRKVDTVTKANFILVNQLIDIVNGSKKFVWEDTWGYKLPDGSWNGMIATMLKGHTDIGGTPLFFTAERIPVVDYIVMTTPTIPKFIFRQPPLSYVSNLFLLPFSMTVWVASAILIVLIVLTLYSIALWEERRPQHVPKPEFPCPSCGKYDCDTSELAGNISDVSMVAVGAISQQGTAEEPKSLPGRISTLVLFVVLMFLYNAYSANIVALLQSQSYSIKTLADLLNSRFKMGVHDNLYNRYFFPRMTEPIRQAIWNQKVAPKGSKPRFMNLEEGVEEMRKGLFAFHMETGVGYQVVSDTFLEEEKCGLVEIPYLLEPYPWFTVQKNSSFKEMFKIGTRRILESGLQSRQIQRLYTKKPDCNGHGAGFISVGINEIRPALVWLAAGYGVAIILVIIEKINMMRYLRSVRNSHHKNQSIAIDENDFMWKKNFEGRYRATYNE